MIKKEIERLFKNKENIRIVEKVWEKIGVKREKDE